MKILLLLISVVSLPVFAQQADSIVKMDTTAFNTSKKMTELIIKSKKPFIEMRTDKMVLNVQSDITASGGNIFELLQKAPGVSITSDDVINLAGKSGVNMLIDGRPTQLSAKDLAAYLKATAATDVDKIELIMNPSAKYDAQGNAGIINIRFKKNTVKGTNGSLSTAYTQSVHSNINFSANLNHRNGSWNWFANITARKWRQNTDGAINRFVNSNGIEKVFENKTVDEDASRNAGFKAGADWFINKKNTLGFIVKGNEYQSRLYTPGNTFIKTGNAIDSSLFTVNDNNENSSQYNFNLNYKYEDSLGSEFNLDADHAVFNRNTTGFVTTDLLDKQHVKYGYTANDQYAAMHVKIYSMKADFSKQLKNRNIKIDCGLKWNTVQTSSDLDAFVWNGSQFAADTGRTNLFHYTESQYSAYASFTHKIKKWEYQFGLRSEYSVIKGKSTDLKNVLLNYPDTAYLNLFPSVFLRYTINDRNNIGISYSKRINRPNYYDLNPFEYIYDNYSKSKGNPYLLPEYSNNVEISYSYRGALNIGLGYRHTIQSFQQVSTLKGEVTSAMQQNAGSEDRLYLNVSLGLPVTKWWESYFNLSPHFNTFSGSLPQGNLDNQAWGMGWYGSQRFSLPGKWNVQVSSWGSIATRNAMIKTAWLGSVDAGISKSISKDRINLRLSVTDIFQTQRWLQYVDFGNVRYDYNRKWESQQVRLQLTWKFGKTSFRERERELGAQDEMNRVK